MSLRKLKIGQGDLVMAVCGSFIHITHPKHGVWEVLIPKIIGRKKVRFYETYSNWYDTNFNVEMWLDVLRDIHGVKYVR